MSEQQPLLNGDQVGWVSLVLSQMGEMERRLLLRLDENSQTGAHRWELHEKEHAENLREHNQLARMLSEHLEAERLEEIRLDARLGPIRTASNLVVREWRTVVIVTLLLWSLVDHAAEDLLRWMTGG